MKTFKQFITEQPEEPISTIGTAIDIYFNNLDEVVQKKIMESVMQELNIEATDDYANKKIVESFGKSPLVTLTGKDITTKIKFDI